MRRLLAALGSLTVLLSVAALSQAQGNPRGSAKLTLKGKEVSVEYGRPALKGRSVEQLLGQLGPGEVWRLGADQSTTFSTGIDLVFGEATIPKGQYSLWARKQADGGWKLVFNKQHGQWGTEHDATQDLAAAPLKEAKIPAMAETVTISLGKEGDGGVVRIHWGNTALSAEFKAK